MKQTILSKCFSKMKRVALTLFAALCVGSVWAEEGETTTPEATPDSGSTPSTSALNIDERFGYVRTGLGELGDQAIVVFTNSAEGVTCTWTPPKGLKNIEFLAVGGGGGGGGHFFRTDSGNNKQHNQGGAGGGGGAVVVGFIKDLAATDVVSVTVGAGGRGGSATSYSETNAAGAGKADPGSNSVIRVNGTTYITAYGGGGDGGKDSDGVANGGSNSGVRKAQSAKALKSVTVIGAGVEGLVSDVVAYANKGGPGKSTTSGFAASGGGGAHPTEGEGHQSEGSSYGGHGGYGYESYITDSLVYYGAGGGGGTGKSSGTGTVDWGANVAARVHGAGRSPANANGTSGLPNQGGGGGGGSYKKDGGAGGSGVVILRFGYSETDIPVDAEVDILPKISDKVYTGEVLSSGIAETFAYKVEELNECVNVGAKVVRVTLNEGYAWADGSTERYKDFTWNILKQNNNVWVTTPFINVDSWGQTYTSSVIFNRAVPLAGELIATIAKDNGENQPFDGNLPTEPGTYKLIYKVEDTSNQSALYWEKTFKIYPSEAFAEGYKVYGLGEKGDEVAVVFTKSGSWTVPANLKNAQFLVVGGGGGGGADVGTDDQRMAGAGGGGGGVVTGYINLPKNQVVSITVGTGGIGGIRGDDGLLAKWGAAQSAATDSLFSLDDSHYVKAYAGGADMGSTDVSPSTGGQQGGAGGSSAGSRPTKTTVGGTANQGDVASGTVISSTKYGNKGGKGASQYQAGGGGGATAVGGNGVAESGGVGGEGLASDITGALLVYGSGGGGGGITADAANGGTGAGNGGRYNNATSGMPNQGGGGGGAGRVGNGGNGGSGIVVFRYSVYQAEVTTTEGSTSYATFADAFAAALAQDGATVKLLNDVTLAEKLTVKKAVTLDLNGCTLSETVTDSYGAIYIGTAGNLTITDSATGGKIATDGGIVIGNYGTVTVAGGTIEAGAVAEEDASVYNFYYNGSTYGKLTVNGGKVVRIWNCGNANITAGEVVDIDNSGAMTIAEAATVSGAVIIKNGSDAAEVPGAGTLTAPESLTVQVGTEGAEAFYVDGKWLVQVVVATIGEAKFASLDAAIAAAQATDTITLVKDIELTAFVSIAKSLTLDLNGKSINRADGTALYVNGDATVTIQGEGSVSGEQAVYVGAGTVVIKGGNYHGYNGGHAVYVQGTGNVEILDGTFSSDEGDYHYVLNKYDADRENTSIVVKGGKFKNFNPANNGAEGANTDFCAEGLCGYVVETVDGVDVYGVAAAVATVGEAKFATLDAAIAAAGAEDEVVVVADIATDAAFEITKKVTINLNGKTIATTQADTEGNGVFWVKASGELTLNGEGTVNGVGGNAYNIAIWADGGKVIINGGTYTNEGAQDDGPDGAHFDLIYVKNGGAVEINGGTFKCQTPEWTLNSHDTKKGTIVVNGGLFYQFNPSDCATEGAGTNWCAEGLKGAESAENAGYYEIVDAWTAPMPDLEDGDTFSGDYEYTSEVLSALEAKAATSVNVKVNGVELKGDEAIKALNTAVASFDDALTFDGTAASLDIEIKVTAVNTEDPAASTVVVKRGTEELTVKATPTVKYFYPETKTWGSDKPESGAVLFKIVF